MAMVSCTWHCVESIGNIPCARSSHAVALLKEKAYLFGGSQLQTSDMTQLQYLNDLYELEVVENEFCKWELLNCSGHKPQPRDCHSMCTVASNLFVFGGRNEYYSESCIENVIRYDTDEDLWEEVEVNGPAPCAIGYSLGLVKKRAFIFGGISKGQCVQDTFMFNFEISEWTPIQCKGNTPSPRSEHGCEVVGDVLFIFGGTEGPGRYCNDLYSFDTTLFVWTNVKCKGLPPAGRAGHSFVAHRDKDVYVFGGHGSFKESTCTTIVHKLSVGNRKWKQPLCAGNAPPIKSLSNHSAFILHSNLFILGGIGDKDLNGFNNIYSLRLINPSLRKPVIEHMLNDFCKQSNSLACWLPTTQPPINYNVGKNDQQITKHLEKFAKTSASDTLPLSTQLIDSEFHEAETLEAQQSLFEAARKELAQAKQAFENDRKEMIGLLERQRNEVQRLVDAHKKQNEVWWKAKIKENNKEREKLRQAWNDLEEERVHLDKERVRLQQKASQVSDVLQQLSLNGSN